MSPPKRRVTIVANRLPVQYRAESRSWEASPGGLVSALTPILQDNHGTWVGWTGAADIDPEPFHHEGISLFPVGLSQQEYEDFYVGFCNGTLWPLYHDSVRAPVFHRHWWRPYQAVNQRFAEVATETLDREDVAWVQDYQLQLVPQMLREASNVHRIGFYLHIPFPPIELFSTLPWRREVLEGLLGADVLAFQSTHSRNNFSVAARRLTAANGTSRLLDWEGRQVELHVSPIGIDAQSIETLSRSPAVMERAAEIRRDLGNPDVIILGVDRLDYTKGIDHRMRAMQTLLERRPDLVGRVVLVQIAVPSREDVAAYQEIRRDIEGLVGRINGDFAEVGRPPIQYLYRTLPTEELLGHYRSADIMLVTPLRDGMNLVAKEYVATRHDDTGILVLSEFAGAAEQLTSALQVNPYDLDGLATTLGQAIEMDPARARRKMRALRRSVFDSDVFSWAEECLTALGI